MYEGLRLSFGLALPVRNTITVFDLFLVQKKKKTHIEKVSPGFTFRHIYVRDIHVYVRPPP